jgi:molybdate transport system regulatory protein
VLLSTRNQLTGTVTAVTPGSVRATVTVDAGGQRKDLLLPTPRELGAGPWRGPWPVVVPVKSTEVMLAVQD